LDPILLLKAAVMGVVEGLTEFLPISSTGHLIIVGDLIDFTGEKAKVFGIFIQTGAMLALIWEYRERLAGAATRRPSASGSTSPSRSRRRRCWATCSAASSSSTCSSRCRWPSR
jgi:undecaprenyl pyrophosphate phosphatase UppP